MSRVTRKLTPRWFAQIRGRNKGFPSETAAWKALAKSELGWIIHRRGMELAKADGIDLTYQGTPDEYIHAAYAEMFPHPADGSCAKDYPRRNFCTWHPDGMGGKKPAYKWCKTAYLKWIDDKVQELKEADRNADNPLAPHQNQ